MVTCVYWEGKWDKGEVGLTLALFADSWPFRYSVTWKKETVLSPNLEQVILPFRCLRHTTVQSWQHVPESLSLILVLKVTVLVKHGYVAHGTQHWWFFTFSFSSQPYWLFQKTPLPTTMWSHGFFFFLLYNQTIIKPDTSLGPLHPDCTQAHHRRGGKWMSKYINST